MSELKEVFFVCLESIHILNGTVRMDFFTLQPPAESNGNPVPEVKARFVVPLQSFLNIHSSMQRLVDKLIADGIVTSQDKRGNDWEKTN